MVSGVPRSTAEARWVDGGAWSGLAASRRGSAHPAGVPNQDAVLVRAHGSAGLVTAVADGHGGQRHSRSDVGAGLAVRLAVDEVATRPRTPLRALLPDVIARWRSAVAEHVTRYPLDRTSQTDPWDAYGSTLLVARALQGSLELAQLGDGDVLVGTADEPIRPVPPDARLVADETTSLCLPHAAADVRFARLDLSSPADAAIVVLATDGLGKSHVDPAWWSLLMEDYEQLLRLHGPAYLAAELPGWLADSAAVAGDDTTVALLVRSEPFLRGPAT